MDGGSGRETAGQRTVAVIRAAAEALKEAPLGTVLQFNLDCATVHEVRHALGMTFTVYTYTDTRKSIDYATKNYGHNVHVIVQSHLRAATDAELDAELVREQLKRDAAEAEAAERAVYG